MRSLFGRTPSVPPTEPPRIAEITKPGVSPPERKFEESPSSMAAAAAAGKSDPSNRNGDSISETFSRCTNNRKSSKCDRKHSRNSSTPEEPTPYRVSRGVRLGYTH